MRLINIHTLELDEFVSTKVAPPYAILSHTWEEGEVTFQDWQNHERRKRKKGFAKVHSACRQARRDGYTHVWVDTNCIDKSSSAELSEAINSMFAWYQEAATCYIYMADVPAASRCQLFRDDSQFRKSRWFTRGWTLQELVAPRSAVFYSKDWSNLGSKIDGSFMEIVSEITGIDISCLDGRSAPAEFSIAKIMSWASSRTTTRIEDSAYCLLGLFGVNMPLLYGEGTKAFLRLQQEIIKISNDRSIFAFDEAWTPLATSPALFSRSRDVHVGRTATAWYSNYTVPIPSVYQMTNTGLSIRMALILTLSEGLVLGVLDDVFSRPDLEPACITLFSTYTYEHQYNRVALPFSWTSININTLKQGLLPGREVMVRRRDGRRKYDLAFSPGVARDILISTTTGQQEGYWDRKICRLSNNLKANVAFFIVFPRGMSGYRLHHYVGSLERDVSMMNLYEKDGVGRGLLVFKRENRVKWSDEYVAVYLEATPSSVGWLHYCRVVADWKPNTLFDDIRVPEFMTQASWVGNTWVATSRAGAFMLADAPWETTVVVTQIIFDTNELERCD